MFEELTIVEWSDDIASQFAGRLLVDFGARVIKIKTSNSSLVCSNDIAWPEQTHSRAIGMVYDFLTTGKQIVQLDMATSEGLIDFNNLLTNAAVFIETDFDQTNDNNQISIDKIRSSRDGLVVLSITPLGLGSPVRSPMNDAMLQHHTGFAYSMARPVSKPNEQPPLLCAGHEGSLALGVSGALAIVWGLLARQAGGKAPRIDLAGNDFYTQLLVDELAEWNRGERTFSRKRDPKKGVAPAGGIGWVLPTTDGSIIVSPREQHQWERWIKLLGDPEWAQNETLCGDENTRIAHWAQLRDLMAEWTAEQESTELSKMAQAVSVACFPVSSPEQLLENAQLLHRDFFGHLQGPGQMKVPVPGLPMKMAFTDGTELKSSQVRRSAAFFTKESPPPKAEVSF